MIINGLQVKSLSPNFEQEMHNDYGVRYNPLYIKAIGLSALGSPNRFVSTVPFLDYLKNSNIGFDYPNREVWVNNPKYSYSYVYSFEYGYWGKRDETFITIVNDYPRYYAQQGGTCKNLSAKEGMENMNIFLLSNPVKITLDEFKQFRRIVARGEFPVERMGLYLFGSIDGFSYAYIGGKEIGSNEPFVPLFEQVRTTGAFVPPAFTGSDGSLYFLEAAGGDLYRITAGGIFELALADGGRSIHNIPVTGNDGRTYLMLSGYGGVVRIEFDGTFTNVWFPAVHNIIFRSTMKGPDGKIYFLLVSDGNGVSGLRDFLIALLCRSCVFEIAANGSVRKITTRNQNRSVHQAFLFLLPTILTAIFLQFFRRPYPKGLPKVRRHCFSEQVRTVQRRDEEIPANGKTPPHQEN
jgi:hypothetical protein